MEKKMERLLEMKGNEMKLLKILEKLIILFLVFIVALIIKDYIILPRMDNLSNSIIIRRPNTFFNNDQYHIMTATAYTRHPDCISPELDDGFTATGTRIRKGVAAINVDLVNGEWKVNSLLRLGQKVKITDMENRLIGYFSIEDTGPFKVKDIRKGSWKDLNWDKRNLDIYVENINIARNFYYKEIKVYPLD